jgi:hypothetical protein
VMMVKLRVTLPSDQPSERRRDHGEHKDRMV